MSGRWKTLALAVFVTAVRAEAEDRWPELLAEIREEFPGVPQLGVRSLHESQGPRTLLVDVREPEEYDVSRLPGARQTQRVEDVRSWLASGSYDRVVVYCSVGYRSSRFVKRLQRAGVPDAVNLEGSIFAWANAGYALENAQGATKLVHPFDAKWGELLAAERRAGQQ